MQMSQLLDARGPARVGSATSKKRLFQTFGEMAQPRFYGLNASAVVEALQERESLGPHGCRPWRGAARHARLERAGPGAWRVFWKLDRPLGLRFVDKSPGRIWSLQLLAPAMPGWTHLKSAGVVSRTTPAQTQRVRKKPVALMTRPCEIHRDLVERRRDEWRREGGIFLKMLNTRPIVPLHETARGRWSINFGKSRFG